MAADPLLPHARPLGLPTLARGARSSLGDGSGGSSSSAQSGGRSRQSRREPMSETRHSAGRGGTRRGALQAPLPPRSPADVIFAERHERQRCVGLRTWGSATVRRAVRAARGGGTLPRSDDRRRRGPHPPILAVPPADVILASGSHGGAMMRAQAHVRAQALHIPLYRSHRSARAVGDATRRDAHRHPLPAARTCSVPVGASRHRREQHRVVLCVGAVLYLRARVETHKISGIAWCLKPREF